MDNKQALNIMNQLTKRTLIFFQDTDFVIDLFK